MALLTVEEARRHVRTGLSDDALRDLLDATEKDIETWDGPLGSITSRVNGGRALIALDRPVSTITTVRELDSTGTLQLTLAVDDWRQHSPYVLQRLTTGTNPRGTWDVLVEVDYVPQDDLAARIRDQIALVKLELDYKPGIGSEGIGDYNRSFFGKTYEGERLAILSRRHEPSMTVIG
jgi:hypothetical protein